MLIVATSAATALLTVLLLWLLRFGFRLDRASPLAGAPEWLQAIGSILDANAVVRRGVNLAVVVLLPAGFAVIPFGDQLGLSKHAILLLGVTLALVSVALGVILLMSERSSSDIAQLLGQSELALENERRRSMGLQRELATSEDEHEDRVDRQEALSYLRDRLSFHINLLLVAAQSGKEVNVSNVLAFLLNEAVEGGDELFRWTRGERWTIAFYLWNSRLRRLECICSVRPSNADFGDGHRTWRSGQGMVGITFQRGRRLIVSDAEVSELEVVMADPDETVATADRERYRSVVALPIFKPSALAEPDAVDRELAIENPQARSYGVVVATSDQPGRFGDDEAEVGLQALAAMSQAASSVLIAVGLRSS